MSTDSLDGDRSCWKVRALRGATSVPGDDGAQIVQATIELLQEMLERNDVQPGDLISLFFTATPDLTAEFPAAAARRIGISDVPLLCACEIAVPGAVERCVRILMHFYTPRDYGNLRHVYLGEARRLRADLSP